MRGDPEPRREPAHDATGIVWGSVLSVLLWPLIVLLVVAATVWL